MDARPTIEQFIGDCFRERTIALRLRLEIHQSYRLRFYDPECLWDSRQGCIERSEGEQIVSVSSSTLGMLVVTTGEYSYRSRYHVKSSGQGWLIYEVDMECSRCRGGGFTGCAKCGGTGWRNRNDVVKSTWPAWSGQHVGRSNVTPEEEDLKVLPLHDPSIERFMADNSRERTASRKKEFEIQADYAKRFYCPEWASTWSLPSVACSEAEKIVTVVPHGHGARVVTSGLVQFRLRYHLLPVEAGWLITKVDLECLICYREGRSANCIWCGGNFWNPSAEKFGPSSQVPPPESRRWQGPDWPASGYR